MTGPTQRQLAQQLTGKDVWAFVVDSGILSSHQEFQDSDFSVTNKTKSRVRCGIDFLASEEVADCKDEWGHGVSPDAAFAQPSPNSLSSLPCCLLYRYIRCW